MPILKKLFILTALPLCAFANSEMEALYLKNACNSCHGMYGEGMGASPRLQGVSEDILLRRLKDLQQGKPRTAFGTVMVSFAKALDENQTKAMAKYLSNLKTKVNEERYDIKYDPAGDGGS
ncbi:MAG TPA: c-type cytochrome [Sulfurovum sp.]|uniref:c-type cytochrome n=1 Tax=Sulfurovum sp. TaxID=1969726 RepID=UPI002F95E3C5